MIMFTFEENTPKIQVITPNIRSATTGKAPNRDAAGFSNPGGLAVIWWASSAPWL